MRKKIISIFLIIVMSLAVLSGCNFFEDNVDKNMRQVVAVIDPIYDTVSGEKVSDKKNIYKYQLIESLNNEAESLMSDNGYSLEEATEFLLERLIIQHLVVTDADRMIINGEIEWRGTDVYFDYELPASTATDVDYRDSNRVKTLAYNAIDSSLKSIREEIITERKLEIPSVTEGETNPDPTFPIKPVEDDTSEEDKKLNEIEKDDYDKELDESKSRWPGYYGSDTIKSLGRESMRRFLSLIKDRVKDNYGVTDKDRTKFKQDDTFINNIINTQGIEYVYPQLYKTHYIKFLVGNNALQQVKLEKLQENITEGRTDVSDSEIKSTYDALLQSQQLEYDIDIAAYNTAMKDGKTNVFYRPTSKYFYVKHILLPFSDAQTAALNKYKSSGIRTPDQIKTFRENLVSQIVVYPHVNGENDIANPTNVVNVFNRIKAVMASASIDEQVAERTFDDFIYQYNTDPGIFNNAKGYIEAVELDAGESETYMPEFAELARDLHKNYSVGQVHSDYAITDYGVHIMYLASKTYAGQIISLNDYETPGKYKTYYEILKAEIKERKTSREFTKWQNERITYYKNIKNVYKTYNKVYKDIYETK